jgi:hypothetical protein
MISAASQEIITNTANDLKKIWVGKLCAVIDQGNAHGYLNPYHYIGMATKDPYECDTFGYVDGKLVRPGQKPRKLGDWYFGDKTQNIKITMNSIVLVVDIVRSLEDGYGRLPSWAAIVLYREKNWKISLHHLAIDGKE